MRNAMNEVTREAYLKDCETGMTRWNRVIEKCGYTFQNDTAQPAFSPRRLGVGRVCRPIWREIRFHAEEFER